MRPGSIVSIQDSTNDAKRKPEIVLVCGPVEDFCRCRRVDLIGFRAHGEQNVVSSSLAKRGSLQTLCDDLRQRQNAQFEKQAGNSGQDEQHGDVDSIADGVQ
eukprot:5496258-Pleurochrysis_carterae.AAC.1